MRSTSAAHPRRGGTRGRPHGGAVLLAAAILLVAARCGALAAAPPPAAAAPAAPAQRTGEAVAAAVAPGGAPLETFKIGCMVPLTGEKATTGRSIKTAIEMAIAQAAPQRLPGVEVSLTCEDTKCSDVAALYAARALARQGVAAIVGDVCSEASLGAVGVVNKFQVPLVSPGSTSPALTVKGNFFFRTVPSDRYQGQFAAAQVLAAGAKTAVVAYTDDNYGEALAYNFVAAFSRDGGEAEPLAVAREAPEKAAARVVERIRTAKAGALFIASSSVALGAALIKAVRAAQPPLGVKIFVGDALMTPALPALAGGPAAVAGVRGTDMWYAPDFKKDFESYAKSRAIDAPFSPKAAAAYDATVALLDAARRAPPPARGAGLLQELYAVKFSGKSGKVAFDESGDLKYDASTAYSVAEFAPGGGLRRA
ncbi:MAG: periplasmic binding protein-like I [Monoraphidium minutum]|nr:MAG: periplasmic binding protein-like I [Monoraphidium minutum]